MDVSPIEYFLSILPNQLSHLDASSALAAALAAAASVRASAPEGSDDVISVLLLHGVYLPRKSDFDSLAEYFCIQFLTGSLSQPEFEDFIAKISAIGAASYVGCAFRSAVRVCVGRSVAEKGPGAALRHIPSLVRNTVGTLAAVWTSLEVEDAYNDVLRDCLSDTLTLLLSSAPSVLCDSTPQMVQELAAAVLEVWDTAPANVERVPRLVLTGDVSQAECVLRASYFYTLLVPAVPDLDVSVTVTAETCAAAAQAVMKFGTVAGFDFSEARLPLATGFITFVLYAQAAAAPAPASVPTPAATATAVLLRSLASLLPFTPSDPDCYCPDPLLVAAAAAAGVPVCLPYETDDMGEVAGSWGTHTEYVDVLGLASLLHAVRPFPGSGRLVVALQGLGAAGRALLGVDGPEGEETDQHGILVRVGGRSLVRVSFSGHELLLSQGAYEQWDSELVQGLLRQVITQI